MTLICFNLGKFNLYFKDLGYLLTHLPYNRFDFSDIHQKSGQDRIMKEEEEDNIVSSLHTILRPFLLRRLKSDGKLFC
jgi:SNF2 family DNA or RNA helicase